MIISKKLSKFKDINHGFFNQNGGQSSGIYWSLNCGIGSSDKKKNVKKNLYIVCKKIGCSKKNLILLHQIHSNKIIFIDKKYKFKLKRPIGDALVTNIPKLAIGILTADCAPILIYDKKLKIISAIHAGWKGAYKSIVKKVVKFFLKKGSLTQNLYVAIGPCITQKNYEVKKKFRERFLKKDKKSINFFKHLNNKTYFSLNKYVYSQLKQLGIKNLEIINKDTYNKKNNFFSARRSIHNKEDNYGRNISLIMIK